MPTSQNGWPVIPSYGDERLVSNPEVPGTGVQLLGGILAGDVATVLLWVAKSFHETVEPLRQGECWGYEPRAIRGSNEWSNHASGTCVDLNSVAHGLGASGTFTAGQVKAIRVILAACGGLIRWGGDYQGRKDEMHFEINGSAAAVAELAGRLRREPGKPSRPAEPSKPANPIPLEDSDMSMVALRDTETGIDYLVGAPFVFVMVESKEAYDRYFNAGMVEKPWGQGLSCKTFEVNWYRDKILAWRRAAGLPGAENVEAVTPKA